MFSINEVSVNFAFSAQTKWIQTLTGERRYIRCFEMLIYFSVELNNNIFEHCPNSIYITDGKWYDASM